jgi:hypothetical protein
MGDIAHMQIQKCMQNFNEKPEGTSPLDSPRH